MICACEAESLKLCLMAVGPVPASLERRLKFPRELTGVCMGIAAQDISEEYHQVSICATESESERHFN